MTVIAGSRTTGGRQLKNDTGSCQLALVEKDEKVGAIQEQELKPEQAYDDLLMQRIDDRLLRRIFPGLCGETH